MNLVLGIPVQVGSLIRAKQKYIKYNEFKDPDRRERYRSEQHKTDRAVLIENGETFLIVDIWVYQNDRSTIMLKTIYLDKVFYICISNSLKMFKLQWELIACN
jgi:hypothetical protein